MARAVLTFPRAPPDFLAGGLFAKVGNEAFDRDEAIRIDRIVPHIGRALDIRRRLDRNRPAHQSLASLLNAIDTPLFLVDASLKVLLGTESAEEIAVRGDGIRIIRDRLTLPLFVECAALEVMAEIHGPDPIAPSPRRVRVDGRDGKPRYLLRILPAVGFASLPLSAPAAALIFVEPIREARALPSAEDVETAYGLTQREAAVLSMIPRCGTRKQMRRALGVSDNTVKSYLGAIFEKTGARNMIELAVLMARCPTAGPRDDA